MRINISKALNLPHMFNKLYVLLCYTFNEFNPLRQTVKVDHKKRKGQHTDMVSN